jgi:phosphopantetheinyl transferase (holo-ACP synthase)
MDSRFLKKILTDIEIDMVAAADDSAAVLWALWASKEAAYKVIKKISLDASFIPRRWSVHGVFEQTGALVNSIDNTEKEKYRSCSDQGAFQSASGHVSIPGKEKIYIRLFFFSSCVHCVASDCPDTLSTAIWHLTAISPCADNRQSDPSLFVRQALLQHLSALMNLNSADMKIVREKMEGELLPPRVYLHNDQLLVDISLSHDGPFIVYAFNLRSAV